jgi:hypothetical protein
MSFDDFSHARESQRAPGLASLVPAMKVVPPNVGKADAIRAFKEHADATNDIFHIAALVIARTILLASRLDAGTSTPGEPPRAFHALIPAPIPSFMKRYLHGKPLSLQKANPDKMYCFVICEMTGHAQSSFRLVGDAGKVPAGQAALQDNWKALLEAWRPFQVAWKAPWWDCVAVPEDVDDEAGFRTGKGTSHSALCSATPAALATPFCTTLSPLAAGHSPFSLASHSG